ncbi:hypothetical protein GCM10007880_36010 [Mesorhizobium amorphae]|nr:hypothetical protein GCM10007880_36010 [Mesorhizobium amorphae]
MEAEKMAGEQDMAGRGDRYELGQALQKTEQQGFDDGLAFHGNLGICGRAWEKGLLVMARKSTYRSQHPDGPLCGRPRLTGAAGDSPVRLIIAGPC